MASKLKLSPRVWVYEAGDRAPQVAPPQLAFAQIRSSAFGDGKHPTTRLCAGIVDSLCYQSVREQVLDVGTGTGILARIARGRGATFLVATDIDPLALQVAKENAAWDEVPIGILFSEQAPASWGARFHLVVANILEAPLRSLAGELAAALAPGGLLVVSGFTPLQIPFLRSTFENVGLHFSQSATLDGWAAVLLRRTGSAAAAD